MNVKSLPKPAAASLEPVRGRVVKEVVAEGEQSIRLAWRTVPVRHEYEPALVVMDWLMDNDRSGLLNVELELTQQVQGAGSWANHLNEAGYFGVRATLQEGQTHAEVEALLLAVVAKLKAGEFSDADVAAIKLHEDIGDKRSLENNWARVSRMTDSFISRRSWSETLAREQRLRAVTRDDVIRVANTYLGEDFVVVNRKQGTQELANIQKPKITPIELDTARESPFAAEVLELPAKPLEPEWLAQGRDYELAELDAGPLIAAPNRRNDLFALSYRFDRGHRKDPLLCAAFELLRNSGSGAIPAAELQRRLFALGTSVEFRCDAETSRIDIEGVDANLRASVELVEAWLREPSFDEATLAGWRTNLLSARKDELDDPDALGWLLGNYAMYADQADSMSAPSNAAIARAKPKQLKKLLASVPDTAHRTLYFGPRSAAELGPELGFGRRHRDPGKRQPRRFRTSEGVTIYFLNKDVAKSEIAVGIPQGPRPREQRPVARYLGQYLGGDMSSLIFQEIREARGLAYYAYAFVTPGTYADDEWALLGGMGTQADKTGEALTTYLELLRERPIDAARLSRSRASLDAEYRSSRVDPRWVMWWVDGWLERGESGDPRAWEWAEIQKLELDDVGGFAKDLGGRPVIISIVGDRERVDLDALARLGTVIEVEPAQLTSYGPF